MSSLTAVPDRTGGSRIAALALAVSVLAGLAAALGLPPLIRAPLGFALAGLVPGWALARTLLRAPDRTPEETAMASVALSVPAVIFLRAAAFVVGLSGSAFVLVLAAFAALAALLVRRDTNREARPDGVGWTVVLGLGALIALPAMVNPVFRVWGDTMHQVAMVYELLERGLPPDHPAYAGMPATYMWIYHLWIAALTETMGVSPYAVFPWANAAMMTTLGFSAYRLAGAHGWGRRACQLAPVVVVTGMNALGWVLMLARLSISPLTGTERGMGALQADLHRLFVEPIGHTVATALIQRATFMVNSLPFRFFYGNCFAAGLTLVAVAYVVATVSFRRRGAGGAAALGLVCAAALVTHPIPGGPGTLAILAGLVLSLWRCGNRGRTMVLGLGAGAGLMLGAFVTFLALRAGMQEGGTLHFRPSPVNLTALVQILLVVALPAAWSWRRLARTHDPAAGFGLGFAGASLIMALALDMPDVAETYLPYLVYLGLGFFAPGGVEATISWFEARGRSRIPWVLAAFVFLPGFLFQVQGYARHSDREGWAGYPETNDEIAVFDYLRRQPPRDAVVFDTQVFYSPAGAAYSGLRMYFGGKAWGQICRYPEDELSRRQSVLVNLFLEPDISEETRRALAAVSAPVYVVARRDLPRGCPLPLPPGPRPDPIEKFRSMPDWFTPVVETPTIALFIYGPGA